MAAEFESTFLKKYDIGKIQREASSKVFSLKTNEIKFSYLA